MARGLLFTALWATMTLAVSSCALGDGAVAVAPDAPVLDGDWRLVDAVGPDGDISLYEEEGGITLTISGTSWIGQVYCNRYGSTVHLGVTELQHEGFHHTEALCLDVVRSSEQDFVDAIQLVDTWERDGEQLTLTGRGVHLVYEHVPPVPPLPLEGTAWQLEFVMGDPSPGALTDVAGSPFLVLSVDGKFELTTGCRAIQGTWDLDRERLRLDPVEMPDADCSPELIEWYPEQDERIVAVLLSNPAVEITGHQLTLSRAEGDGLRYVAD